MRTLLTIAEASRRSGFSRYAITLACKRGELMHYRPTQKGYQIPIVALESWMRAVKRGFHASA